jgi:hypothetical protein
VERAGAHRGGLHAEGQRQSGVGAEGSGAVAPAAAAPAAAAELLLQQRASDVGVEAGREVRGVGDGWAAGVGVHRELAARRI